MNGAHDPGDPAENLVQGEFLGRLRHCLARLPKRQGDTFLLIHLEGHTTAEVARIQGVRSGHGAVESSSRKPTASYHDGGLPGMTRPDATERGGLGGWQARSGRNCRGDPVGNRTSRRCAA